MPGVHFYCHAQISSFALRGISLWALLLGCVGGVELQLGMQKNGDEFDIDWRGSSHVCSILLAMILRAYGGIKAQFK